MENFDHETRSPKPENRYKRKKGQTNWISKSLLNIPNFAANAFSDSKNDSKTHSKGNLKSDSKPRRSAALRSNLNRTKKRFAFSSFSVFEFGKKNEENNGKRRGENILRRSLSVGNNLPKEEDEVFEADTESLSEIHPLSEPTTRRYSRRHYSGDSSSDFHTITASSNDSDKFSDDLETERIAKRKHGLKHLSRSTPTMSPSGSPPHSDSEGGQSHISRRTKKFLRRFRNLPPTEKVINYYACAIVSDILLQGTLYITDNYFAFYSNIFGYVNRTLIPIVEVSSIQKEKTAKFIPNAVGLHTVDGKTYVFSSLISRDATYKFMTHVWRISRKLTDSDLEGNIPPPEENFLNDSGSISGDSAVDDNGDYPVDTYDSSGVPDQNAVIWSKTSPIVVSNILRNEASLTNSENDSSYTTPETCLSTNSFNDMRSSVDRNGTSASENEVSVMRRDTTQKSLQLNVKTIPDEEKKVHWSVRTKVVNSAINIGVAPFRAVKEGLQEVVFMPNNSGLLIISSGLVLLLLMSALFMIYRVETLSYQLNTDTIQYGDLYEEVLRMQQKIHAATAKEIENTLNQQIRQLVTVKQSLEALIFLLDTNRSSHPPPVSEKSI